VELALAGSHPVELAESSPAEQVAAESLLAESHPVGSARAGLALVESLLAESHPAESFLAELALAESLPVESAPAESHPAVPAAPVERAQAAARLGRRGVKGARLGRVPAQPPAPVWFAQDRTRAVPAAAVRGTHERTMNPWEAAARSQLRRSVTAATTATRFSWILELVGVLAQAAARTSVAAPTAPTPTAAGRLCARWRSPSARRPMSCRTPATATRAASCKASALLPPVRKRRQRTPQAAAVAASRVSTKTAPVRGARWQSVPAEPGRSKPQPAGLAVP